MGGITAAVVVLGLSGAPLRAVAAAVPATETVTDTIDTPGVSPAFAAPAAPSGYALSQVYLTVAGADGGASVAPGGKGALVTATLAGADLPTAATDYEAIVGAVGQPGVAGADSATGGSPGGGPGVDGGAGGGGYSAFCTAGATPPAGCVIMAAGGGGGGGGSSAAPPGFGGNAAIEDSGAGQSGANEASATGGGGGGEAGDAVQAGVGGGAGDGAGAEDGEAGIDGGDAGGRGGFSGSPADGGGGGGGGGGIVGGGGGGGAGSCGGVPASENCPDGVAAGGGGGGGSSLVQDSSTTTFSGGPASVVVQFVFSRVGTGPQAYPATPTATAGEPTGSDSGDDGPAVPLSCAGPSGSSCALSLTLQASAPASGRGARALPRRDRAVTLGQAQLTMLAGQSQQVRLVLNATARRLLRHTRALSATLRVIQRGDRHPIAVRRITLKGRRR